MRHLSAERLAAVADEHPTPDEAAHLAQCAPCVAGRDAHRRLIAGAALERDRPVAPLSDWGAISARLRAEGVIRTPAAELASATAAPAAGTPALSATPTSAPVLPFAPVASRTAPVATTRRRVLPAWALQAAAALVLVVGGVVAGRATSPDAPAGAAAAVAQRDSGPASTGMLSQVASSPAYFASTTEAREAMLQAERTYQAAMQYLAENDSTLRPPVVDPVNAYRARLAALDEAVEASRRALSLAPTDPLMNDFYLTSVSARETTLRQIDDALPVNERVTRF